MIYGSILPLEILRSQILVTDAMTSSHDCHDHTVTTTELYGLVFLSFLLSVSLLFFLYWLCKWYKRQIGGLLETRIVICENCVQYILSFIYTYPAGQ